MPSQSLRTILPYLRGHVRLVFEIVDKGLRETHVSVLELGYHFDNTYDMPIEVVDV